ncbi:MAG: PHP domain-containing protein, partial [Planctomycetes bacterium]|nr:PHP domain-containing protein [Planctomycetota bacterium]
MCKVKEGQVDLHTHSNFSDGSLSPAELVEEAVWKGLSAIALTDHDNIDGLSLAAEAGKQLCVEIIHGVELSCEMDDIEVHIVGLFIEPNDELRQRCDEMCHARESRMERILEKLGDMGINITMDDLPQEAGKSVGRPHLAKVLVERGVVKSIGEAFARYIGDNCPANVSKDRFSVEEAVRL